ncbi:hypothetical protein ASPWEDRAFT_585770 [Aspergillus wentii DTO 134E9]|uniref:Amino acid permease/ SLC12A domain-containing protein n=1 Tax=Aspergillus wentii DTO 134E9 TaxID=1073089 RepID=A0A1L9RI07_ASPWE|nr:uncharacterized protein ASPWEDRAFT_585770 [Aspergillus wentii DTO 134E9]KAI9925887.1 hypothetical protein MW887_005693 [Aspergillus wentii]OJJ34562.1 hypothetical protein ASPWEDRAFT_585770 [Aspergillus wentii DTO 134E9]
MASSTESDFKTPNGVEKTLSPNGAVDVDYGATSDLHRTLSTRHMTMIALGSSIGMGLWLGSGTSLASGGPASIFIGYILSGTMVWAVSHSIGEMAVMYPLPSAFVQWTTIFVDPSAGFALGWAYWFMGWITVANELQGVVTVLGFWTDKVPTAAWISIFWVVIIFVNVFAVKFFGEVEVVSSTIKFTWIIVVIISLIVISAGGGPVGGPIGFRYWNAEPFINGFKGFLSVMPTCIFAMSGSEYCGMVAAETSNPRKAVPKAVGSIWMRLSLFYVIGSLMITIAVSPNDHNLFGGSGSNASPFVIAYRNAGIPALAHIMNAVIFISVISSGSVSAYAGSRNLMGLAHLKMAPSFFGKADKQGRPIASLTATLLVGGGLAYLNVNNSGAEVFTWLSNLTSLFTLFGWGMISLSHIRMRYAWKAQGRSVSDLPWKSWTYPYAAIWSLFWCILLIIIEFYLSVWPLHEASSAKTFFANYVSVVAILVVYAGARIYYRGAWWVDASTIDLDAQRRFYVDNDEEAKGGSGVKGYLKKSLGALTD